MAHVTDQLTDYLDSAGTPEELRRIERHLRECAECRTAYDELRTTIAYLAALPRQRTPRSLKSLLLDELHDSKHNPEHDQR